MATSVGTLAPDLMLQGRDDQDQRLSDLWKQSPLVLIFLRHFG
jgi:peroxiredoxin